MKNVFRGCRFEFLERVISKCVKGKSRIDDTPGPGSYNPDENGTRVRPSSAK